MRKVIAERLHESTYSTPHYYLTQKVQADKLIAFREEINQGRTEKISLNDLFIKAVALTCREVEESRSSWDGANNRIVISKSVDVCFAVDTGKGLITPMIRGADRKRLSDIGKQSKELIGRAKENKLVPNEYMVSRA